MYHIFLISNSVNDKIFVSVQKRTLSEMETNLRRRSNQVKQWNDSLFISDLKQHGIDKFKCSVVDVSTSKDEANKIRDIYIKQYKTDTVGYNTRRSPGKDVAFDNLSFILALTNRQTGDITILVSDSPTNYRQLMLDAVNEQTPFGEFSRRTANLSIRYIGCEIITYSSDKSEVERYTNHLSAFLTSNEALVRVSEARLKRILRAEVQNLKDFMSLNRQEENSHV